MALAEIIIALARDTWRTFAERGRTDEALYAAMDEAVALSDTLSREILARGPTDLDRIACAKGCAWCCRLQVGITAPQALHIARKIAAGEAALSADAVKARVSALDALTRGLNAAARLTARLPCAFLENDRCTIYAFRPFACRGANSVDAELCRAFAEGTAETMPRDEGWVHKVPYEAQRDLQEGLRIGMAKDGLRNDRLELAAAVRVALDTPDAARRWIAGEDVFSAARVGG